MHASSKNPFSCVFVFLFLMNSCSSNAVPNSAGILFDPDFGARTMNAAMKGVEAATGLSKMFAALAQGLGKGVFGLTTPLSPPFSGASPEISCSDGGTMTVTGFDAGRTNFSFEVAFSNCRENGIQIDGPASATGISSIRDASGGMLDMNLRLGNDSNELLIQNFQTVNRRRYGHLKSLFGSNLSLGFQTQSDAAGTYTLTLQGEGVYDDFTEKTDVAFLDFKSEAIVESVNIIDTTVTPNTSETTETQSTRFNGVIRQSKRSDLVGAGVRLSVFSYNDLRSETIALISKTEEILSGGSTTVETITGKSETRIYQGGLSLHASSRDCVIQGDFTVTTLEPLRHRDGASCPVSGHLSLDTVSGTVDLLVNTDQTIAVRAAGGEKVFNDCADLFSLCSFEDFQTGFSSRPGRPSTPVKGDRAFITLTWVDNPGNLQVSDMDLHVGYYLDPASVVGVADALVSWHSGGGDDCGSARAPSLFNGVEAILDVDDCSGLGPEHVSIRGLPAGYYVIAVNSFDLKGVNFATVNVTVEIGKSVFTFEERLFLQSDKDKADPNAWYRVTDLQCVIEGECTFLAPNLALKVHNDVSLF